jgi:hypothetical protein
MFKKLFWEIIKVEYWLKIASGWNNIPLMFVGNSTYSLDGLQKEFDHFNIRHNHMFVPSPKLSIHF